MNEETSREIQEGGEWGKGGRKRVASFTGHSQIFSPPFSSSHGIGLGMRLGREKEGREM